MIPAWFLSSVGNLFNGKLTGITWQEIRFCDYARYNFHVDFSNKDKTEKLIRKYFLWQSREVPTCPLSKKNLSLVEENGMVKKFSHEDDFSWNSLSDLIANIQKREDEEKERVKDIPDEDEFPF